MKTLDEVIAEMEVMGFIGTLADALYYLKEYRSDKIQYEADRKNWEDDLSQKLRFFDEARNKLIAKFKELEIGTLNEPLTWDELKTMEGKPVWIEHRSGKKGWCLIVQVDDSLPDIPCVGLVDTDADYRNLEVEWMDMGQWQAYRKEKA